jgi:hypothetical protein
VSADGGALTPAQVSVLAALADVLIPAAAHRPAASEVDVAGRLAPTLGSTAPHLLVALGPILDGAAGPDPAAMVEALERQRPADFEVLLSAVAATYYASPVVHEGLGYAGQRALPTEHDADVSALVASVVRRGRLHDRADGR